MSVPIIPTWMELVIGLFGAVGIAGAAAGYFNKNRAQNVIALQREELAVTKETNQRLIEENKNKDSERAVLVEKIAGLEKQLEMLRNLVTAAPQIAKLSEEVVKQHKEVLGSLDKIAKLLNKKAAK